MFWELHGCMQVTTRSMHIHLVLIYMQVRHKHMALMCWMLT